MAQITIRGLDELRRKLGRIEMSRVIRPGLERGAALVAGRMAEYPSPPAGSTYQRTGTLGRRWTHKVERRRGGLAGVVGNNTSYGPWVQSHRLQARVHRGRWQTDEQVADEAAPDVKRLIEREIRRAL